MTEQKSVRQRARERGSLGGADAQALEGALSMTERERDAALRERDEARVELGRMRDARPRTSTMTTPANGIMEHAAVVLLSGGFDSVAALHWAAIRYRRIIAISFLYGQPNVDQESTAAGLVAASIGIEWRRLAVSDAVRGARALESASPVVPGRNLVFLSIAAAHAAHEWQLGRLDLVIGSNADDADQFPDCRLGTLLSMTETLSQGLGRECRVVAPWIDRTKSQILYSIKADPVALAAVRRSWSCYHSTGPCGACGACVKRAAAFAAQGVEDECAAVVMGGGDRSRER